MARIDWRFVVGFVMAWLVATGALVAAGISASAPVERQAAQASPFEG